MKILLCFELIANILLTQYNEKLLNSVKDVTGYNLAKPWYTELFAHMVKDITHSHLSGGMM
jgi:hypothetical protein